MATIVEHALCCGSFTLDLVRFSIITQTLQSFSLSYRIYVGNDPNVASQLQVLIGRLWFA